MYMNANSYSSSSKGIIHLIVMLICSKILTQTETASPRLNILTQRQHSSDYGIGDFRGWLRGCNPDLGFPNPISGFESIHLTPIGVATPNATLKPTPIWGCNPKCNPEVNPEANPDRGCNPERNPDSGLQPRSQPRKSQIP